MSNRRLVLFCSVYPSNSGERFLHNEMVYLREAFNDIIVVTDNANAKKTEGKERVIIYEKQKVTLSDVLMFRNIQFILEILKNILGLSFTKFKVSIKSYLNGLSYKKFISNLIDTNQINLDETVFYTYWFNDATFGLTLLSQGSNIKYVTRVHRWDLYEEENLANYLPFRNCVGKSIDIVYSISEDGCEYLIDRYPSIQEVVQISRLGVKDYGPQREKISNSEYQTIVSCSNVIPVKRVNLILEALSKINDISIRWVHFGAGSEFESLKNQAESVQRNCLNLKIELKGGVPNSEILDFYHAETIALFINVSRSEGVPVSIMEAMEAGIPILATNVGGSKEVVKDGVTGVLMNEKINSQELKTIIVEFLTSKSLSKYGDNSRMIYQELLNADVNYAKFINGIVKL